MEFKYIEGWLYKVHSDRSLSLLKARSKCNGRIYFSFRVGTNRSDGKTRYVHRKIWELHNGEIPKGKVIDHINGDTLDNRIENLQCISQSENMIKAKLREDNLSGYKNISVLYTEGNAKYTVRLQRNGVQYTVGTFFNLLDAIQARDRFLKSFVG